MTTNDIFRLAMKRSIKEPLPLVGALAYDIGAGYIDIDQSAIRLGLPDWSWPRDPIPAESSSVDYIHCYHFLEHLSGEDAIRFLQEVQRVLKGGGVFKFCVPYYNSSMMGHDLTHKSSWNEETLVCLFKNDYYDRLAGDNFKWHLRIHFQFIIGIVERNIALVGQLVKV